MKVLITGGAGFIGSHVAELFYSKGFEVFILDPRAEENRNTINAPITALPYSILDPICEQIFQSHSFHTVVHLAAQVSVAKSVANPILDAQTNIIGLLHMLEYARAFNVKKFIFASSAAVYGNNSALPLQELYQPSPIAPYGISKLTGEHYCSVANNENLQTVSLRFSNVFGPRQTSEGEGGVISIFMANVLQNKTISVHGDGTQTRDFIYVKDVANAIWQASTHPIQGVFNVSTKTETSIEQIVKSIEQLHGPIEVCYTARRQGDIDHSTLDNELLQQQLKWSPKIPFEVGLKETYEWANESLSTAKNY